MRRRRNTFNVIISSALHIIGVLDRFLLSDDALCYILCRSTSALLVDIHTMVKAWQSTDEQREVPCVHLGRPPCCIECQEQFTGFPLQTIVVRNAFLQFILSLALKHDKEAKKVSRLVLKRNGACEIDKHLTTSFRSEVFSYRTIVP